MAVYFIRWPRGPVKIGHAQNVRARLACAQTDAWKKLILIRTIEGAGVGEERAFHQMYADRRIRGEWFSFCGTMLTASVSRAEVDRVRADRNPVLVAQQIVGAAALQRRLRLSDEHMRHILWHPRQVRQDIAIGIEKMTDGAVTFAELRSSFPSWAVP